MTLVEARDMTIDAVKLQVKNRKPVIKVMPYEGTFSIDEVKRLYSSTPVILISPLSTDKEGVKLAVYLLAKQTDKGLLDVVDGVINTLRHLPGAGRPILDVSALSLYDKDAGKMGARLWGFTTMWPHMSVGQVSTANGGTISNEIENIRAKILSVKNVAIGGSEAERSVLLTEALPPFVLITPKEGTFNIGRSGSTKYSDDQDVLWTRYISGSIKIPILIECVGRNEAEAEDLALLFLPLLAYADVKNGLIKKVIIAGASPTEGLTGTESFSIELTFESQVGGVPSLVPVFRESDVDC